MKYWKAIKLGLKMLKESKKQQGPIFGDNPMTYGVDDPGEKDMRRREGQTNAQISVFFPESGGSFTNIHGEKFPFPGIPDKDVVMDISKYKKMVPVAIDAYADFFIQHALKPEKYCKAVREIYRLFTLMSDREMEPKNKDRWLKVRDMVCVILEFDNAYRFRLQDMIKEARIEELELDEADKYWAGKTLSYKWGHFNEEQLKQCRKS